MKKLLTIIFCSISLVAGAQQFRYGFHVSPVANLWDTPPDLYERYGPTSGIQYGILFDQTFGAGEHIALTGGITLDYTQGGMASVESTKNWMVRAQYIEIPVSARIRTGQMGVATLYAQGGATFGKCLRARGDYTENGFRHDTDINYLNNENPGGMNYLHTNLGIDLGIGSEFAITETASVLIGVFYQKGLSDVFQDNNVKTDVKLNQMGVRIAGLF